MKKQILTFIADFETSYINEEQLLLPAKQRERYCDGAYIRNIEEKEGILFQYGEKTIGMFLDYLFKLAKKLNKTHTIRIGFHNLKYDWSYIVCYLNLLGYSDEKGLHKIYIDTVDDGNAIYGATIYYAYRTKDKNTYRTYKIEFFDTYKLFPLGVAKMGKALSQKFGYDFCKGDFDYNKIRDYNYRYNDDEKNYIKRDVDIVVEYYNHSPSYMKIKNTMASNSLYEFKSSYLPKTFINAAGIKEDLTSYKDPFKYLFPNEFFNKQKYTRLGVDKDGNLGKWNTKITMKECNDYFSDHYYGGVTMCNPIYKGKMIINENYKDKDKLIKQLKLDNREYVITRGKEITLDVNSLYPYIMDSAKLPYGEPIIIDFPSLNILKEKYSNNFIFLKITNIHGVLKEEFLPIIPKNRTDKLGSNMLYKDYLSGDSYGCNLDEWELINKHYNIYNYEVDCAYIFKCVSGCLFSEYVQYFTNEKIRANKFNIDGSLNPNYDECKRQNAKIMQNSLYGKFGTKIDKKSYNKMYIDNEWVCKDKIENREQKYIYPIIASAITSYARQYMFSIIDSLESYQFIYMDTDSIHMLENDKNNLETLKEKGIINDAILGKLKHENSTHCSIYLAPKKYAFIDLDSNDLIIKCAGLPDDAKEKITAIEDFYYGYETHSKLQTKYIKGGIDLVNVQYRILKPKESVENCLDIVGL